MFKLKSYIDKKSRSEGSIANWYLAEECMYLMSKYLNGVETSLNWPWRNQEGYDSEVDTRSDIVKNIGRVLGVKEQLHFIAVS